MIDQIYQLFFLSIFAITQARKDFPNSIKSDVIRLQGWAKWSKWGPCSSTCGGGISYQFRKCLDVRCVGAKHRVRLCNARECEKGAVYAREIQCPVSTSYNMVDAELHDHWSVERSQCLIYCRSLTSGKLRKLRKSKDGTPCEKQGLNVSICLDGKCQGVGCDGIIGSNAQYDPCGVCGGNGDSCIGTTFRWKDTKQFSPCDASCGASSYRVSVSVCHNVRTNRVVPERLCADQLRPRPIVEKCPYIVCPEHSSNTMSSEWMTGKWSDCSKSCDGGTQNRQVYCVERDENQNKIPENRKVSEKFCWDSRRPLAERKCNEKNCPRWEYGDWSSCSVTCGKGIRTRKIECRQEKERVSKAACLGINKLEDQQVCYTGVTCEQIIAVSVQPSLENDRFRYVAQAPFSNWETDQNQHNGFGFGSFGSGIAQPKFFPGQWGPCSTTCGPGMSTRTVECVAVQGLTANIIKLPDYECEGSPKPNSFQPCNVRQCPQSESVAEPPQKERPISNRGFRWDYGEWTPCSASCLGGKQRSTLKCIDEARKIPVAWSFCDAKQRPIDKSRPCNNDPCPPEWDLSKMSDCSHTCGGGLRTRKVRCTRRMSKTGGAESTLILPDSQCPYPKPQNSEACGLIDCPIMWKISQWSSCSTSCSPGEQRREVICEQRTADGRIHIYEPPIHCRSMEKPPTVQLCNLGPCSRHDSTHMSVSSKAKNDMSFMPSQNRKLTLNIGGKANLYQGTSIKIRCPVKNFLKHNIRWEKDGKKIINNAHIKVSANGALRIFHTRMEDEGVYSCIAGKDHGNVTLTFKARESADNERSNDSRKMLEKAIQDEGIDEDPRSVDRKIIEKVREALKATENYKMYDKLRTVQEPGNIKVDYAIGDWSLCSQNECGKVGGAQVRQLKCRIVFNDSVGYLTDEICETFGVTRPPSSRSCSPTHCPHWEASEWSECSTSRCIRYSVSVQRRDIKCLYDNGTIAKYSHCDRGSRPKVKKECINTNCTGEWRPSVWGLCSRTCGDGGVQMRLLSCVWHGTHKAAGRSCETSKRPSAIRACNHANELPPCPSKLPTDPLMSDNNCIDKSRYCEILKLFQSCEDTLIKEKCCHYCRNYYQSN